MSSHLKTLSCFLPLLALSLCAHAAESRPNLGLILADDMGYDDLGCTGSALFKTPHITDQKRRTYAQ